MSAKPTRKGLCRCEARIAPALLDGYACGNPDCWRTEAARASFEAFVSRLEAGRGDGRQPNDPPPDGAASSAKVGARPEMAGAAIQKP